MVKGTAPVLLFHATFSTTPKDIDGSLDNIHPEKLRAGLKNFQKYFTFVHVDDLLEMKDPRGHMALTFDDGYASVLEEALPVLRDLGVPATVYFNSGTIEGRPFWRDSIRFLINSGFEKEAEDFLSEKFGKSMRPLYGTTKHPSVNSIQVEAALRSFFEEKGLTHPTQKYCISTIDHIVRDPLLQYGNHSRSHYILSSLSRDEQYREIGMTKEMLGGVDGITQSNLFSVPVGRPGDYNDDTISILKELGYAGMLMSRGRLQKTIVRKDGFAIVERFMPARKTMPYAMKQAYMRMLRSS